MVLVFKVDVVENCGLALGEWSGDSVCASIKGSSEVRDGAFGTIISGSGSISSPKGISPFL